jgi:hypothetical protein
MTVSQIEAEVSPQPYPLDDHDQRFVGERPVSPAQQSRRNPPARNTSRFWFERFLAVIQRQNPAIIDASFLSQIAPSNEGKLLAQLKFLGVIDEQGKPTPLLPMLNMVGEDQKKAFQDIVKQSYSDLFSELKVEKAVSDDLINFFIRKYSFTRDKAVNATKFVLYLTEKGAVPVSLELNAFLSERSSTSSSSSSQQSLASALPRLQAQRDLRSTTVTSSARPGMQKKANSKEVQLSLGVIQPLIQATVSIVLDKDTPKEYWDRVLAILGEKRALEAQAETQGSGNGQDQQSESVAQDVQ